MASTHIDFGYAEISLVEPHRGTVNDFNEWYENDHSLWFAAGPGVFARGRFVATKGLKELRFPADSDVATPHTLGTFLALYWIERRNYQDLMRFAVSDVPRLREEGRAYGFGMRDHVATAFFRYLGCTDGPTNSVDPANSLDREIPGLVALWLTPQSCTSDELATWCREELDLGLEKREEVAQVLDFAEDPYSDDAFAALVAENGVGEGGRRLVRLYLLSTDPYECFDRIFNEIAEELKASGKGILGLAAPFVPIVPGASYAENGLLVIDEVAAKAGLANAWPSTAVRCRPRATSLRPSRAR